MKEILVSCLSRNGALGGIKFDLDDEKFDNQNAVGLLPRTLLIPYEMLIIMCISGLSESNKDLMVNLLAEACCERLEHFITLVRRYLPIF